MTSGQSITVMDRAAINRWLCPNGGRPVRGRPGRCDGAGMARGGGGGAAPDVAGWHADLPPPTHRQIACPIGTVATQARANPGTVRCLPKVDEVRQASAQAAPPTETAEAREAPVRPAAAAAPSAPARPEGARNAEGRLPETRAEATPPTAAAPAAGS
ncbi:hypothetical protein [Muricoccus roseus]|nr:hypothetical protein [Roseomonas rosea]